MTSLRVAYLIDAHNCHPSLAHSVNTDILLGRNYLGSPPDIARLFCLSPYDTANERSHYDMMSPPKLSPPKGSSINHVVNFFGVFDTPPPPSWLL